MLWVKEDKVEYDKERRGDGDGPPPPPVGRVTATTWEKILELAGDRPLVELHLMARTPAAAAALLPLAQPLGADSLLLSVTVGGALKEAGSVNFAAADLKPNHPIKPLTIAQTLFNALGDSTSYEADLALGFTAEGRTELEDPLRELSEAAPEGVYPRATFERPIGVSA
jgi:hypothetical protein